jgi:hypothetical protein
MGWVVSVTPRPPLPQGQTRYPLYRRLGGPQGRSGRVRKISPRRDSIPGPSNYWSLCVFLYSMYSSIQYILTLSAWSLIIWTRKLTYLFFFSVQLEAHSSSWWLTRKLRNRIYLSDFCRCILSIFLLYKYGLLSTSSINFSMSSTIDIAVWLKTHGLCTLLQLASADRLKQVRPILISNIPG